jgi:membrane protein YdbS with pleckstrin-like domain
MTNPASATPGLPPTAPPPEVVIARLRSHARVLFWPTVLLLAVSVATGYYYGNLPEAWQNTLVLAGAGLLVVLAWLLPLVSWLTRRYTITTRRIIFVHGIFVHVRQELLHSRGYDVSLRRTWLQSLFRSGTVRIDSGAEHRLELTDVPDAALVQRVLADLSERSQSLPGVRREEASAFGNEPTVWPGR